MWHMKGIHFNGKEVFIWFKTYCQFPIDHSDGEILKKSHENQIDKNFV